MADPVDRLLDEVSGGGVGPSTYWNMFLVGIVDGRATDSWSHFISDEEWSRIASMADVFSAISKLEFTDTDGCQHVWFGVRVLGGFRSTFETRRSEQTRAANWELYGQKIRREQRKQSGEWDDE